MTDIGLAEMIFIAMLCLGTALGVLWVFFHKPGPLVDTMKTIGPRGFESAQSTCFLVEGEKLIDATVSAYGLLGPTKPSQTSWARIREIMLPRFPDFPDLRDLSVSTGQITTDALEETDNGRALIEWWDGKIRVELIEKNGNSEINQHMLVMQQKELKTLRDIAHGTPYPVWQTASSGNIVWTNNAYDTLMKQVSEDSGGQAPAKLFDLECKEGVESTRSRTTIISNATTKKHWYDISTVRYGDNSINYAIDVNAVVNAEVAQRNFVQTLTKTFAHLPIGLAIFDRNRQLALFNPSLIDLTALPADFLSTRPNLLSFFDKLRDNRMMPEPKNYTSWRKQIADLVAAATDGRYFETWTLESGLTYRVSGRPHPDGAIAFLIEDISAEISLTQRFRAQLNLGQSTLDKMDESIAVFSPDGIMVLSNSSYQNLWGIDPDSSFAAITLSDATEHWRNQFATQSEWENLRNTVIEFEGISNQKTNVKLVDGKMFKCTVSHISGGILTVKFGEIPALTADKLSSALV